MALGRRALALALLWYSTGLSDWGTQPAPMGLAKSRKAKAGRISAWWPAD
jgi:hypothetical protein